MEYEEGYPLTAEDLEHTDICPTHGREDVVSGDSTGGPDPYHINILACGHGVICMGPGEPNVIVSDAHRRLTPTQYQGDLENGPSTKDWMHP